MIYVSLAIVLAILAGVILFITRPFFGAGDEEEFPGDVPGEEVDNEDYQAILKRIRELDFDHQLGKVSAEDYTALRDELKHAAAECLQRVREVSLTEDGKAE